LWSNKALFEHTKRPLKKNCKEKTKISLEKLSCCLSIINGGLLMKYKGYSAIDFANDTFFIRWVKNLDEESDWFWESFIKENPGSKPEIEKARGLISLFDFSVHDLPEEALNSMRNGVLLALRAEKEEGSNKRAAKIAGFLQMDYRWWHVAAAMIIIPLVSAAVFFFIDRKDDHFSIQLQDENWIEKRVNPSGQKSVLFLVDGTKVWLNAASRISFAKDFVEHGTRDVYLDGEAFFDVAHNGHKPFIVHTSSIKIKVLGTSFNVKSYSEEKTIETTLVHGKIRIEQSDVRGNRIGDVELKPNQRAVFDKELKIINIKEVVGDNSASWKRERLVFDEESIDNVILQMERWYNVKIHVANKGNLNCKLTASIENESLEEMLKLIEVSHNIHYTITGSQVLIEGKLCENENK
jgi:transmembrane sensor